MKGSSNFIMAAVLVMVVSLAIVLGLVLILLAELYCSVLFGRRQKNRKRSSLASAIEAEAAELSDQQQFTSPPLNSFYAQGVIRAPRNFLFPAISDRNTTTVEAADLENQIAESPDSGTFRSLSASMRVPNDEHQLIYICNPIYDNNEPLNPARKADNNDTPFETPDSSPSRLEAAGSPGSSDNSIKSSSSLASSPIVDTPPLTPMKMLEVPSEDTSSLCLRDARSICTTGSDSNEVSSSSGSTRTSPSW